MKFTSFLLPTLAIIVLIVYFFFDPASLGYFPSCPLKASTGFDCPGCGSQRAFHELLHLNISEAFRLNSLFVLCIPYLVSCAWFIWIRPSKKWKDRLMGNTSTWIILGAIVLFGILRNVV
ncbi:MAG: DUF2752 domain-containing protein [Flavobacteriales bacterium]|nr:DUF2752 domain-containing protein [Flavobacteriales bacterium]